MSHGMGFAYGLSQAVTFFTYGAVFYMGAWLISDETDRNPQPLTFEPMMMYVQDTNTIDLLLS